MVQVNVFCPGQPHNVEAQMNTFLGLFYGNVVSITYQMTPISSGEGLRFLMSAMIVYNEKNPELNEQPTT
jgi:Sporulation protein Cse60